MCDDHSVADMQGLSRRGFALGVAGFGAALADPVWAAVGGDGSLAEAMVSVPTADGHADAFFVHPAKGRHPGVLLWPDIAGLRETYKAMARRLAAQGYAVLAVNHYYRNGTAPLLSGLVAWMTPEGSAKIKPALAALTPAAAVSDAHGYVAWLDAQAAVDQARGLGTVGYCAGGALAVRAAGASRRIRAVASLHGAALVSPAADAPYRAIAGSDAAFLFAIGRNDDARSPGDKDALRAACAAAGRPAEIEVYPADHGWCTLDAPSYDKVQADRAFGREVAVLQKV